MYLDFVDNADELTRSEHPVCSYRDNNQGHGFRVNQLSNIAK